MTTTNEGIHYKYWIGILVFLIVLVISLAWADIPGLVDKLSFALTISSVILALLAIYFTVNFNSLFSNNINTFLNLHQNIEKSSQKLIAATQDLNVKLDSMPQAIQGVDQKIDRVHKMLEEGLPSAAKIQVAAVELNTKQKEFDWTEDRLKYMFVNANYSGMLVMYLLGQTFAKAHRFTYQDIIDKLMEIPPDFFNGYASSLNSFGLCHIEYVNGTYVVTAYNEVLNNNVKKWLDKAISVIDEPSRTYLEEGKTRIDGLVKK